MLEDLIDVPPAIPLLVVEVLRGTDWSKTDPRVRLKKLLPELKRQSEWFYATQNRERIAAPGKLDLYLDGGLNLFDPSGACQRMECRIDAARRLCRSVGLIADTVWITDHLTRKFVHFGRVTEEKLNELVDDTLVLGQLWPLIEAGIVRFTHSELPMCQTCMGELELQVDQIADHLVQIFDAEFDVERAQNGAVALTTGNLYYPPMYLYRPNLRVGEPDPAALSESAWSAMQDAAWKALWIGYQAAQGRGTVFSNSRPGMAALAFKEGHARSAADLQIFEAPRELVIPWVSELHPREIVQLRQEASKALPIFRETFSSAMRGSKPESMQDKMSELREQATEVRGELENAQKHAGRFWKSAYTTLGFGVSAYGLVTDQILPALSGLLPVLQLMVAHKAGTEKDIDRLKRKPGYVLVKAQDILAHRHGMSN